MGLYEILLIKLGGALSRAAVKRWIGDSELLGDVSGEVSGLLLNAGSDAREAHRAKRELSEISEQIADRLEPFFTAEYGDGLAPEEAAAAALAVATTLNLGFTHSRIAFAHDLDAERLAGALRAADPDRAARDFLNPAATRLYDIALSESCSYLVQMVGELPHFAADATRQLLSNDRAIVKLLEEALLRLPPADTGAQALEFRTRYVRAVTKGLDQVRLFGLQEVGPAVRRYALSVAYISLSASIIDPESAYADDGEDDGFSSGQVMAIEDLLSHHRRLLLRGQAGSGKTTLLQWLAVQTALRVLPSELSRLDGHVPFFIRLRRYVDTPLPAPSEFIDDVGHAIAAYMPAAWVESLLDDGSALVLIDGVDELPRQRRAEAERWLKALVESFPDATYVVTSRPAGLESGFEVPDYFERAELAPMGPGDIKLFVDHWHRAVARGLPDTDASQLLQVGGSMARILARDQSLARLGSNPLMAAVLCALHADRKARLPRDRVDLYRVALNTLLFRRDEARGVQASIAMSETQLLLALKDLAWWMVTQGYSEAEKTIAEARMQLTLDRMQHVPAVEEVMRFFIDRTGLLNEPVHGRIEFLHKTFLEFLAAQHAIDAYEVGALVQRATDEDWAEIVLLAAGVAPPSTRTQLIKDMLTADVKSSKRPQLCVLAAACVDAAPEVDPVLRDMVNSELAALVPPKTVPEGLALARAGETAVKFLPWSGVLSADSARASVRALATIGGPLALEQLIAYGNDGRKVVLREILEARAHFDPVEYARRVLADSPLSNGKLELRVADDLSYLGALRHLKRLTISAGGRIVDLQGLADAEGLQSLQLASCPDLHTVRDLGQHRDLRTLVLHDVPNLVSLEGLETWPLRRVELESAPRLEDLRPLQDASALVALRLAATAATDFGPLGGLPRLEKLHIANQPVVEWSILGELPALQELVLQQIDVDLDLSWLGLSPTLQSVELRECGDGITFATFAHRDRSLEWLVLDASGEPDLRHVGGVQNVVIARSEAQLLSLATTGCEQLSVVSAHAEFIDLPRAAEVVHLLHCEQLKSIRNAAACIHLKTLLMSNTRLWMNPSLLAQFPSLEVLWLKVSPYELAQNSLAGVPRVAVRLAGDRSELPLPDRVSRLLARAEDESPF